MPQAQIFRWRAGSGWIVLSGGGSWDSDDNFNIESHMLNHTHSAGPMAYIWAASDLETADRHMDALNELGARTGYLVDVMTESDDALTSQLSEAGVIILGDGPRPLELREGLIGPAMAGIEEAFRRGATLYAPGNSAALFGAHILGTGELFPGFGWLSNAIIVPYYDHERAQDLRAGLLAHPENYGAGLNEGAGLALGPAGQVEVWGNRAVTISLGQQYTPDTG